jgi:hypothetical protein
LHLDKDGFDVKAYYEGQIHLKQMLTLKANYLKKYDKKLPKPDMFNPNVTLDDQLKEAYRLKNKEIAFSPYSKLPQEENYD